MKPLSATKKREVFNNYINGNLSVYFASVKKMTKLQLLDYLWSYDDEDEQLIKIVKYLINN